jgi:hypothetical protein
MDKDGKLKVVGKDKVKEALGWAIAVSITRGALSKGKSRQQKVGFALPTSV